MPQMAPLSWVTLFCLFIGLYLMNSIKIYYLNESKPSTTHKKSNLNVKTINWKW